MDGKWVLKGVDESAIVSMFRKMKELIYSGHLEEAVKLNREFGLRHGFPTGYAMINPVECLAELSSYIYYDPRAKEYLRPEVMSWVRENVLR